MSRRKPGIIYIEKPGHEEYKAQLSMKLSNGNVAVMTFKNDDPVQYCKHFWFYYEENPPMNYWVHFYVGPAWKRFFAKDHKIYGTTKDKMEGWKAAIKMMGWFVENMMKTGEVLEVSGFNRVRDRIYHHFLKRYGFRNIHDYNGSTEILVYIKTPKYHSDEDPEFIYTDESIEFNPRNLWSAFQLEHGTFTKFDPNWCFYPSKDDTSNFDYVKDCFKSMWRWVRSFIFPKIIGKSRMLD
jgi:hypothetical protein